MKTLRMREKNKKRALSNGKSTSQNQ
jgi:hypothetical protein